MLHHHLILASSSPRRRVLLTQLGLTFECVGEGVRECRGTDVEPEEMARRNATEKAVAVSGEGPIEAVLGADTVVILDGVPVGKPDDVAGGSRLLWAMRERTQRVVTATAVLSRTSGLDVRVTRTELAHGSFSRTNLSRYLAAVDVLDKAGGIAVQAACWREELGGVVRGCIPNAVGLPLCTVVDQLATVGLLSPFSCADPSQCSYDSYDNELYVEGQPRS